MGLILCLALNSSADLIFTELMYNPKSTPDQDWEFVEVLNNGASGVSLMNWKLDDVANGGTSPATIIGTSFTLAAGGVVVLSSQTLSAFNTHWGTSLNTLNYIAMSSWPTLNNDGDSVRLIDNGDVVQRALAYSNTSPWPSIPTASSSDSSIMFKLDPGSATVSQNDDGANWVKSAVGDGISFASATSPFDIGSPGSVVPEPATAFAGIAALSILLWTCRKRVNQKY